MIPRILLHIVIPTQSHVTGKIRIIMQNRIIPKFRCALIIFCLFLVSVSFAQRQSDCDLKFVDHLVRTGNFKEALYLLDSTDCHLLQSNDSVNYLRGWSLYSLQRLQLSSESLLKVHEGSDFYAKSRFFAAYNYTHLGDYDKALNALSSASGNFSSNQSLHSFEKSGIFLLMGDTARYKESIIQANRNLFELSKSYDNLEKVANDLIYHKKKSPFLAGILSGVIPGSGKFYAGRKGGAISAFIATTGLGLVTLENHRKNGWNNFATIAFGAAFALSYVSNIYGAVLSAQMVEI